MTIIQSDVPPISVVVGFVYDLEATFCKIEHHMKQLEECNSREFRETFRAEIVREAKHVEFALPIIASLMKICRGEMASPYTKIEIDLMDYKIQKAFSRIEVSTMVKVKTLLQSPSDQEEYSFPKLLSSQFRWYLELPLRVFRKIFK